MFIKEFYYYESMKTGIKVGELMTRNFIYVAPNTNLKKCAETMVKKRVGSLIIKENQELKGILTEKDIIWAVVKKSKKDLDKILAKDLMKKKVVTISPYVDIVDALEKIKREKVRRLPVVENGKIIGLITLKDILKIDPGLFEVILETMKIKEEQAKLKRSERIKVPKKDGICEECGETTLLYQDDSQWICENCYNAR